MILIEELRIKRSVLNEQMQVELLGITESDAEKNARLEFIKFLAERSLYIEAKIDQWLKTINVGLSY